MKSLLGFVAKISKESHFYLIQEVTGLRPARTLTSTQPYSLEVSGKNEEQWLMAAVSQTGMLCDALAPYLLALHAWLEGYNNRDQRPLMSPQGSWKDIDILITIMIIKYGVSPKMKTTQ